MPVKPENAAMLTESTCGNEPEVSVVQKRHPVGRPESFGGARKRDAFGEVFFHFALMSRACNGTDRPRGRSSRSHRETFAARGERRRPPIADAACDVTVVVPFRSHTITKRADNLSDTQTFKISAQSCKFAEFVRISSQAKMLPNHISIICTRPLGRIDNVALKRWALFTVE
jgi:hypothetical protein